MRHFIVFEISVYQFKANSVDADTLYFIRLEKEVYIGS